MAANRVYILSGDGSAITKFEAIETIINFSFSGLAYLLADDAADDEAEEGAEEGAAAGGIVDDAEDDAADNAADDADDDDDDDDAADARRCRQR